MSKFNPPTNLVLVKPRVSRLVSCLVDATGHDAENIGRSFTFNQDEDRNVFTVVLRKFDQ